MNLLIFQIKIRNSSKNSTVGPMSQILDKLTKSEHPFRDESNHTKITKFRHRIRFKILILYFWKILQNFQFLASKSEISDEYRHGFMKYKHFWL